VYVHNTSTRTVIKNTHHITYLVTVRFEQTTSGELALYLA